MLSVDRCEPGHNGGRSRWDLRSLPDGRHSHRGPGAPKIFTKIIALAWRYTITHCLPSRSFRVGTMGSNNTRLDGETLEDSQWRKTWYQPLFFISPQTFHQAWPWSPPPGWTTLQFRLPGSEALAVRRLIVVVQPDSRNSCRKDVVFGLRTMSQEELSAYGRLEVDVWSKYENWIRGKSGSTRVWSWDGHLHCRTCALPSLDDEQVEQVVATQAQGFWKLAALLWGKELRVFKNLQINTRLEFIDVSVDVHQSQGGGQLQRDRGEETCWGQVGLSS